MTRLCGASLPGCTVTATRKIYCRAERAVTHVCFNCENVWRINATSAAIYDGCPVCATWSPGTREPRDSPAAPAILRGPSANAIEHAMHAEGILFETATAVLRRLQREAPWIAPVATEDDIPTQPLPPVA